jgi:hypothetical protein
MHGRRRFSVRLIWLTSVVVNAISRITCPLLYVTVAITAPDTVLAPNKLLLISLDAIASVSPVCLTAIRNMSRVDITLYICRGDM